MKNELLDIYNERMALIGQEIRSEVHRMGYWHKAFHCWILSKGDDGSNNILFQLRSKTKDFVPNSLDISAAGHLKAGENSIDSLRELKEELGISIEFSELKYVGVHVEVYCDDKSINREFDEVYFLRNDKELDEYVVEPDEVIGLTKINIQDGIDLFSKKVTSIKGVSTLFDEKGLPKNTSIQDLKIDYFAGGERNNYFIKILLLAERYFNDDELLFI